MLLLEVKHPKVAFRDCQHCRTYYYDEKTGEPRMARGKLLERVKPPPCETPEGCPKGHWKNPKQLRNRDYPIVDLAKSVACGAITLPPKLASVGYVRLMITMICEVLKLCDQARTTNNTVAGLAPFVAGNDARR